MPAPLDFPRWSEIQREHRNLTLRDAARELGLTPAALMATDCGGITTRLSPDWPALIKELPSLGRVLCITGNPAFTHERYGEFRGIEFYQDIGVILGEDIDLRLFMRQWAHGFATTESSSRGDRKCLYFFNSFGAEIHKVILQKEGSESAYDALVAKYASPDQSPTLTLDPATPPVAELPDSAIDTASFHAAWLALEDTVHFVDILRAHRVRREQGLRLAPAGYTRTVSLDSVRHVLESVADMHLPIMIFVRSPGCLQIHSGLVHHVKMFGRNLLNILDPEFNLHIRLPQMHSAWIVRKPTIDGEITSLEIFDAQGENLALFFGKRGYGKSERPQWRQLLTTLS